MARRSMSFDVRDFRLAGTVMLVGAFVVPLLAGTFPEVWCPLRATTGVPCPFCGLTTSVTATMHLDLPAAVQANPFGIVAVVAAGALLFVRKRTSIRIPLPVIVLGLALSWIWELGRYGFL